MPKDYQPKEDRKSRAVTPKKKTEATPLADGQPPGPLASLQQKVGNQAVQRLIAQRNTEGDYDVDDETATRINQARGGGQSLDGTVQKEMSASFGEDLSGVRAHTSAEADELNQQLGARAFTTGQDIFFREGEYKPNTGAGQELIAHELTHVVQQQRGDVPGGDRMRVNAPGDAFEQEADAVAKAITQGKPEPVLQRQEEEEIMMQPLEEEEEMLQAKTVQRQEIPEEEELQLNRLQRQEEEEDVMMQPLEEEEEMVQTKKR